MLVDLLETKYDIEVLGHALCGLDGLALVSRHQPDVLFLDVELPDVGGLDFLEKLSGFTKGSCQVVMYTAHDKYVLTAFRKHAFDVLLKPIDSKELDTIMKRLEKVEERSSLTVETDAPYPLDGKLLVYTSSSDFKLVKTDDVCLFLYNREIRCWEAVVADSGHPLKLKRNVKSTDLLALDSCFLQVNQKFIVNANYLMEVTDNLCHFYPPFDSIDFVKVGRFYRKSLVESFLSI